MAVLIRDQWSCLLNRILPFILFSFFLNCAYAPAQAQSQALSESQIKAAFLFNFTKFVEWPPDAFQTSSSPIILGVIGDNTVTELLTQTASGKTVNGRTVIVRSVRDPQDFRACQILFVSSSEQKHMVQILEKTEGLPVLMVGEVKGFAEAGGGINFIVEGNKVRLEINLDAASRAHLKISAKVIAVARLVTDENVRGKS